MQEVLNKLNELVGLLQSKLDAVAKKEENLADKDRVLKSVMLKQEAADKRLAAKERVIAKAGGVDSMLANADVIKKEAIGLKGEVSKLAEENKVAKENMDKEAARLAALDAVLKRKDKVLSEQAIILKEKEAKMKDKVLEEIRKKI